METVVGEGLEWVRYKVLNQGNLGWNEKWEGLDGTVSLLPFETREPEGPVYRDLKLNGPSPVNPYSTYLSL